MTDPEKTVFISYRRNVSSYIARAIFLDLRAHGYDVFMDVESIDSGTFDTIILNQIEARGHFLIILTPGTVERCAEPDDWLRREVEFAIEKKRNIVPVLVNEFKFAGTEHYLTGKLSELQRYSGLTLYPDYFEEGMARLRNRFLKQAVHGKVVPAPAHEQATVQQKIEETAKELPPTEAEVSAEQYFNEALSKQVTGDIEGAIADYTEAIRLNPLYAAAYNNRGYAQHDRGNLDEAIVDYSKAIAIVPQFANAYNNRGYTWRSKGNLDRAITNYTEAIRLNPQFAEPYYNRAEIHFAARNYQLALSDFQQTHRIRPKLNVALAGLAISQHALGYVDEAKHLWVTLIAQDERYKYAKWADKLDWVQPLVEEARKLIAKL